MKWIALCLIIAALLAVRVEANSPLPPPPAIADALTLTAGGFELCYTSCGGVFGVPSGNADYEQQVIELVNAERLANGNLAPLKKVDALTEAARYHATDMGQDNYFNHNTYDRNNGVLIEVCGIWDRVVGYYGSGWSALAENIAAGYSTPAGAMAAWMNSSGHRANILNPNLREIGVGYASVAGSSYTRYWVQNFGAKSARYPLVINREAAAADDYRVSLYIYGAGVWPEMRLRNNAETWTAWQPFQANVAWELPKTRGTHTVTVELRTGNNSTSSSDAIYMNRSFLPTLGNIPTASVFFYELTENRFTPETIQVAPMNTTSDALLTWIVTQSGDWFTLTPASGSTPGAFTITPHAPASPVVGAYPGSVTVTVTVPLDTQNSPQSITLTLHIIETSLRRIFLPLVSKN